MSKRIRIAAALIIALVIIAIPVSSLVKERMERQKQESTYVPKVGEYQVDKCRSMLRDAKKKYEKKAPPNEVKRPPLDPVSDITEPRYMMTEAGIYDNAEAEDSGDIEMKDLTYIPCYTVPEYEGNVYTVVPLTEERVDSNNEFEKESKLIKKYMGKYIPCESGY